MSDQFEAPPQLLQDLEEFMRYGDVQRLKRWLISEPDEFVAEKIVDFMGDFIKSRIREGVNSD